MEGFGVESEKLIGPNTSFEIAIHLTDRDTMKQLDDCYLTKFTVEVRWSRASNEGFKHGLKIMGLATSQQEILHDILDHYVKRANESTNESA